VSANSISDANSVGDTDANGEANTNAKSNRYAENHAHSPPDSVTVKSRRADADFLSCEM
jgi:hypothetical protein